MLKSLSKKLLEKGTVSISDAKTGDQTVELISEKYQAKFGSDDQSRQQIDIFVKAYIANKAKPLKLARQDFQAME